MSWGIEKTGTPEALKNAVDAEMSKIADSYKGKPEADDIRQCKARILALIDACDLSSDGYTTWNAVTVKASGSHSTAGPNGLARADFTVSVTRTAIAL